MRSASLNKNLFGLHLKWFVHTYLKLYPYTAPYPLSRGYVVNHKHLLSEHWEPVV